MARKAITSVRLRVYMRLGVFYTPFCRRTTSEIQCHGTSSQCHTDVSMSEYGRTV